MKGKALLATSELLFRGPARLKIPFKDMTNVAAADGQLIITFAEGQATFHLGKKAATWAAKILNPPSRLDKLGVKPGTRVRWIGPADKEFKTEAAGAGAAFVRTNPDLTFLSAATLEDLSDLNPDYAPVWVVYPKGIKQIREIDILNAGRKAGLVDIKVASFSPTKTGLKFVPPKARG